MREEEIEINEEFKIKTLELKVLALNESIQKLTSNYEDRIADLRIEVTLLQEDNQQLQDLVRNSQTPPSEAPVGNNPTVFLDEVGVDETPETVEGELVQEED